MESWDNSDDAPSRAARRPAGWIAPGPRPAGSQGDLSLAPSEDEERSLLSGEFQILQRRQGHRWSMDDLVTAWVAQDTVRARWPDALELQNKGSLRFLDMGCGIGSVLLMQAWSMPRSRGVGIEAQAVSAAMAQRSVRFNGVQDRVSVLHGDLRDPAIVQGDRFEIVTGTPPYFRAGEGVESPVTQRGPCRFEHRGGVEDYALAAKGRVAEGGRLVLCAGALERARAVAGFAQADWHIERWVEVIGRRDKSPLIDVYVLREPAGAGLGHRAPSEMLVVRERDGQWSEGFARVRAQMGLPPKS
ncbi:MAG: methyltransferase [Deltaproteobacteria bacterium]|nr:methyltransferase [Deltaproteobacteria bacterium]